jgi:hypothetical protein
MISVQKAERINQENRPTSVPVEVIELEAGEAGAEDEVDGEGR